MKFKKKNPKPQKSVPKDQIFRYPIVLNRQTLSIFFAVFGLFLSTFVILITSPKAIAKLEGTIFQSASDTSPRLPVILAQQVKVAPVRNYKIIDSKLTLPTFTSNVVLAQDLDSGQILYEKNVHSRVYPASTTKVMTALVALDHYKSGDVLSVPKKAMVGGSTMDLVAGEKLTFRSLLYGMLLNSGNDAAYTMALNYPGGIDNFVLKMNEKAQSLGLLDTHFENPAGFDDAKQYSSAFDLAIIAKEAMKNDQFSRVVATKDTQVASLNQLLATPSAEATTEALTRTHPLKNLNKLLTEEGVVGVKTGTTDKAGENLIALINRNDHSVITVVLGSTNRFEESKTLIEWVYRNYSWQQE